MKKIILICLAILTLAACKDTENTFQPAIGSEAFSFTPIAGGAVMHYTLPADKELIGLNVRYKDFSGKEILRSASSLSDSLELPGFNKAEENIPAAVRLVKKNGEESDPIAVNFSTNESAPYAFFNNVKVSSGWNGFSVTTDNPKNATGMAHVFYLGKNPLTGEPDTVLIKSFNLTEGKDTMKFEVQQKSPKNTIVIRTEDFRGYMVREEVYPDILSYNTGKLDPSNFDFFCDKSIEDPDYMIGKEYLFDGDLKGIKYFDDNKNDHIRTFMAGPYAIGAPMYIDMRKNMITASVNISAMSFVYRFLSLPKSLDKIFMNGRTLVDKLPCDVDVYAAKDDNGTAADWDSKNWVKVASYSQDPEIEQTKRWCAESYGCYPNGIYNSSHIYTNKDDAEAAKPITMNLSFECDGQEDGYRYLKIVVNKTFVPSDDEEKELAFDKGSNVAKYITFNELEVYTKKDE